MLDVARTKKLVEQCWADEIIPTLVEYIKIPNKSPSFDPDWVAHGYMDEAAGLFERWAWAKLPSLTGATLKVARLPGRTPVIVIDVPGEGEDKVSTLRPSRHSRKWPDGPRATARGSRVRKATSSMAAAGPMTDTRCSARWAR